MNQSVASAMVVLAAPMTGSSVAQQIIVGVDTHKDVHVAAAIDGHGRLLGHRSVANPEQVQPSAGSQDPGLARRLWARSAELTAFDSLG